MTNPSSYGPEDCAQPDSVDSDSHLSLGKSSCVKVKQTQCKACAGPTVSQLTLPPCRVCGEKASGFHYGANTCEACKVFFRRSLCKEAVYTCHARGKCEILPGKRSSCAACRLKKCVSIGMSTSAIKTGRYTYAKKARYVMELKGLKDHPAVHSESELSGSDTTDHSETQRVTRSSQTERELSSSEPSTDELDEIIQELSAVMAKVTFWTPDVIAKQAEREKLYVVCGLLPALLVPAISGIEIGLSVSRIQRMVKEILRTLTNHR